VRRFHQFILPAALAALASACAEPTSSVPAVSNVLSSEVLPPGAEFTPITKCQTRIRNPGRYRVMRDLSNCPNGPAVIWIQADNVTLQLNGHPVGMRAGWNMTSGIEAQGNHIAIEGPSTFTTYLDKAIQLGGAGNSVRDVRLRAFDLGIVTNGPSDTVERVTFGGGGYAGIYAGGGGRSVYRQNHFDGHLEYAITGGGDGDQVVGNRMSNTGVGVNMRGAYGRLVAENTILNSGIGVQLSGGSGNMIRGNLIQNSNYDLYDENPNTCTDNTWINNIFTTATQPCMH
jgi:parallel beta-helix repeat protein